MGVTQTIGNAGEKYIEQYIKNKGFIISARNYRTKYGEIDIIAEDNDTIIFVEVKTRSYKSKVRPYEYVDIHKQRKICVTANIYLQRNGYGLQPRFDVAEVFTAENGEMCLNYFENAFGADVLENF